ncbi:hypothetical protein AB0B31_36540 [Catellatospora citrea]|uniref:hypothetical protein n=1 Tax=Catellatospora citrea TaxID=53366 RepID=UPI0033D0E818
MTFSMPEEQRTQRHHLRSTLGRAWFALLREGLRLAPGEAVGLGTTTTHALTERRSAGSWTSARPSRTRPKQRRNARRTLSRSSSGSVAVMHTSHEGRVPL